MSTKSGTKPWSWGYTSAHERWNYITLWINITWFVVLFMYFRNPYIALHLSHCALPGAISEQAVIGIELSSTIGLGSGPTILHSGWIILNKWKVWIWCIGWWRGRIWEEHNELPSTVRITMERQSSEPHMGFQGRYRGVSPSNVRIHWEDLILDS